MKLCSRLLMVFCRNFCEKQQIWVSEPHFEEVRGDARPWLMARWKAHDRLSIRVNWTFFAIYYGSGVMKRNVYNSAVFTGAKSVSVSCCLATSKIQTRFCSCDLELDLDLDIRTWPLHTKMKFLGQNFQQLELEQDRQTDRRTDGRMDGQRGPNLLTWRNGSTDFDEIWHVRPS